MDGSIGDEDEKKLLLEDHPPKSRKGGNITILIILVNDACERAASIGLVPNMVFYLMNEYHLEAASASIILSVWTALSNGLAILGGFLADSYLGRFRVIALGSISSLSGTILIWLTAMIPQLRPPACERSSNGCNPPGTAQLFVLLCSFALISTGAGLIRPCSIAFGIDQVDEKRNPNGERAVERYINWYNGFLSLASVFTMTVIVYIQDNTSWKVGFAVCAIFMAFSAPVFLLASSLYVKIEVGKSVLTDFFQVIVVALKNKSVRLPPPTDHLSGVCYYQGDQTTVLAPTDNLRCLNKACIVRNPERDINPDGSCSDPWSLCTVEQVEALKNILRIFPIWSTSIMLQASIPGSFTTLQAKTMYRHITASFEIPAATLAVIPLATCLLCACIYEGVMIPLLVRCTGQNKGISAKTRMALGLMCTCIAMAVSAVVETTRRNAAIRQGAAEDIEAGLDISFMWLIPQYVLNGLCTFFFGNGLTEYLYTQLGKKMGSIAVALAILSTSAGGLFTSLLVDIVDSVTGGGGNISWLASDINKGHLDYYYWLLGLLSLINFVCFYLCWWLFGNDGNGSSETDEQEES